MRLSSPGALGILGLIESDFIVSSIIPSKPVENPAAFHGSQHRSKYNGITERKEGTYFERVYPSIETIPRLLLSLSSFIRLL